MIYFLVIRRRPPGVISRNRQAIVKAQQPTARPDRRGACMPRNTFRGVRVLAAPLMAAALLAALTVGCDSKETVTPAPSATPTEPTTGPATQAADVIAPTTQPSQLIVDGKAYEFPPAKLRVSKSDGHVVARLY